MNNMASQLPPELLILITSNLPLKDKLACSNVCLRWHKNIKCTTLLSHLLFESYFHWLLFDQLVKEGKLNGDLVKKLEIGPECFRVQSFCSLPRHFPRLEELLYKVKWIEQQQEEEKNCISELEGFRVWEQSLVKLELRSMISFIPALFQTLCFSKLTSICLKWPVKANENMIPDSFLSSLTHLPSLDSLHICFSNFSLGSLEMLHENAPNLTMLTIEANILTERSVEFPNGSGVPQPLPKLKSFRLIGDYSNFRMATAMFIYFILKYRALEHFYMIKKDMKLGRFMTDINLEDMQRFERARETFINTLPLKTFGMNHHALSARIWRLICQKNIKVTDLGASYLSLDSLAIIFNSESKNINHIKTLIISHFEGNDLLDFPFMPRLKRLGIRKCYRSNEVPMDKILERSPCLHYLFLYDCVAHMSFPTRQSHFNSSLKTLSLDHISLESNVFDYISKYCPLLENLHLDNVHFVSSSTATSATTSGNGSYQVSLPNHNLKELFILMPYGINCCTIKTETKRHRFCAEFSDRFDFYLFQRPSSSSEGALHIIDLDQYHLEQLPPRFGNRAMYLILECKSAELFRLNYEWINLENPSNLRSSNL